MRQASSRRPANPLVPRPKYKGGGSKAQSSEPAVITADEIPQLRTDQRRTLTGMLLDDEVVPQKMVPVLMSAEQIELEPAHLLHRSRHRSQPWQRLAGAAQLVRTFAFALGQAQPPAVRGFVQSDLGTGDSQPAIGRPPV